MLRCPKCKKSTGWKILGICPVCYGKQEYRGILAFAPDWLKDSEPAVFNGSGVPIVLIEDVNLRVRRAVRKAFLTTHPGHTVVMVNEARTRIGIAIERHGLDFWATTPTGKLSVELVMSLELSRIGLESRG